ncbi:MAG TPA: beta-ketoacyl synthase N-terminal-like domain-containing protein [Bradyrhizobium sp.]|nr:beta-ketoacyl synthase N-terminal-like domain-containing protein [Bradyrhizobium sp.]
MGEGNQARRITKDDIRAVVRRSVAQSLKMEQADIKDDKPFSDYGVDSITAVGLVNKINGDLHITLPTIAIFDHHTAELLADHIDRECVVPFVHSEQLTITEAKDEPRTVTNMVRAKAVSKRIVLPKRQILSGPKVSAAAVLSPSPFTEGQPTYYRVVLDQPGKIDDIRLMESALPELGDEDVRIAVRAYSLNFGDLLCVKGLYPTMPPYPFTPGVEASGVVVAVGKAVFSVRLGDAVIALMGETLGAQASVVTCRQELVMRKPASLSFEEACALPVVTMTMIDAFRKARLKKGEKILIQTAAGGTGLVAVQLAKHCGAVIFGTAGSSWKLDYLRNIGVDHPINYRESDFEDEIRKLTDGKGVDVVINTLPGDAIQKGLRCLSAGGRYIEIAMTALRSAKSVDLSVLNNNQSVYSVDLRKLLMGNKADAQDLRRELLSLIASGVVTPTVSKVFELDSVREAYACLEDRQNIGKIVVRIPERYRFNEATRGPAEAEKLRSKAAAVQKQPIAVIGMSGRFAKSRDVAELWEHLARGDDLVDEVTRWDLSKYITSERYCRYGSLLDDIDCFDPLFFNISGLEATFMDPQQRLFLEEAWTALEDAGYVGAAVEGRSCGVYVGCAAGDYSQLFGDAAPAQSFWGNAASIIPARIAYYLNLQGPALAVDTACSSSLVAIHLACQGLWGGETELALAGGVFVHATPQFHIAAQNAGMLSISGHCHAFGDEADGFVPGEGIGVVVLKRLSEAQADGDHIYGVIAGSAINQDGATNGITAPSALSQERLERAVYDGFAISPEEIQMMEAHGTGTKLGDPIEFRALTRAFRAYTNKPTYCALGSIKTNLGHTAMTAGVAGVIKILLSLKHEAIPPSLHYGQGNPNIAFQDSPFYVNTALKEWAVEDGIKRRAAVSSFGFSGTNCHMVIEEAAGIERRHEKKPGYLIVLSARSAEQLRRQIENLAAHCERMDLIDCGDLSFTLLLGRKHFNHRMACVVGDRGELVTVLNEWLETGRSPHVYVSAIDGKGQREQPLLKRFGSRCIQDCQSAGSAEDYLEHLTAIAELYVQGCPLEFTELFATEAYRRLSLPTYPFAKERYWASEATPTGAERWADAVAKNIDRTDAASSLPDTNTSVQRFISPPDLPSTIANLGHYARRPGPEVAGWLEHSRQMDDLLSRILWVQLSALGFPPTKASVAQIRASLGVQDLYERWLEESLGALTARGYLQQDGVLYSVASDPVPTAAAVWRDWDAHKATWLAVPALAGLVSLVEKTLQSLPGILTGKVRATEVLFPGGSMALMEGIYKDNPISIYFNEAVAEMAARFVEQRLKQDASTRIRILEVGAGTGATTARVLSRLKPYRDHIEEYCYTDLSRAFLTHGENAYGRENPYLHTRTLDVEKPVIRQGLRAVSYDLVIAANVLHATRNVHRTVRNVKAALRKNGLLLLNEIDGKNLCMHLSLALLEGWWLYEDAALRTPGCPGLSPDAWARVLEAEGFPSVFFPVEGARDHGLQVIVAESDGAVRNLRPRAKARRTTSSGTPQTHKDAVTTIVPTDQLAIAQDDKSQPPPVSFNRPAEAMPLHDRVRKMLIDMAAAASKVRPKDIDGDAELSAFGFDSILVMQFGNEIKQSFGVALTLTAFSEFPTLNSIADHLISDHAGALNEKLAARMPIAASNGGEAATKVRGLQPPTPRRSRVAKLRSPVSDDASARRSGQEAGFRSVILPGTEPIPAALYYPSRSSASDMRIGGFTLSVARNGIPTETTKGLILISHGGAGGEVSHHNLARHLAREGFLVVAPQHPGDNWIDRSLTNSAKCLFQRPKQLSRALDALLADPQWADRIPSGAIGAIGHSMGTCSVLTILGAQVDRKGLIRHWENIAGGLLRVPDRPLAEWISEAEGLNQVDMADDRVRAAVLLAPYCNIFKPASLSDIMVPLRIYTAEKDALVDNKLHGNWLRRRVPNAELEEVENAGHFAFAAIRDRSISRKDVNAEDSDGLAAIAVLTAEDPQSFDRHGFHRRLGVEVAEFFSLHLAPGMSVEHHATGPLPELMEAVK